MEPCWLFYTFWGSYLSDDDYVNAGIETAQTLMKHWGPVRMLDGSAPVSRQEMIEDITSADTLEAIIRQKRDQGDYHIFEVTYFNPSVQEEPYVNRLVVSKRIMKVEEYDGLKFFQTNDSAVNEKRTVELLKTFVDVASNPKIREIWMGENWNAFMGEPAFLYRPDSLYERVQDTSEVLETREEVLELVNRFHTHVSQEFVIRFFQNRLGQESVQEMGNNKILVQFYDRELTRLKVNTWDLLKEFERHVDQYLEEKGVRLYG